MSYSFQYRVRNELRASTLHLGETVFSPHQDLPPHSHAHPLVLVFLEGSGLHRVGDQRIRMGPGDVAYVPPGAIHGFAFGDSIARVFSIELHPAAEHLSLPARGIQTRDPRLVGPVMDAYRIIGRGASPNAKALRSTLVHALGDIDARRRKREAMEAEESWLPHALSLLDEPARGTVRIGAIARALGKHPSHLSRRFRETFGESMVEVRERARIEAASRALLSGLNGISAIAADLGFCDHAHLTRSFRRAMRMTPLEFRQVVGGSALPPHVRRDLSSTDSFVFRSPPATVINFDPFDA
jgi:AraC family transcriptional regulator